MKKTPFVTLEKVQEIAEKYPTPFHLYDEKGIRENAQALKEAFAWNKGFKEFFAVYGISVMLHIYAFVDILFAVYYPLFLVRYYAELFQYFFVNHGLFPFI